MEVVGHLASCCPRFDRPAEQETHPAQTTSVAESGTYHQIPPTGSGGRTDRESPAGHTCGSRQDAALVKPSRRP